MNCLLKIYEPAGAMIDWDAFGDCIITSRWARLIDLKNDLCLSQNVAHRAWHGKSIGTLYFVLICDRMGIDPRKFLVRR